MHYELWSMQSRNIVDTWLDKEAALEYIRDVARENGNAAATKFILGCEDSKGETQLIAQGLELAELAGVSPPAQTAC